jgi:SAM-dependent methyltransferase
MSPLPEAANQHRTPVPRDTQPAVLTPPSPAEFSHRHNFTAYMKIVAGMTARLPRGRVLDLPAGAGQMSQALRDQGHEVVPADINAHDPSYVWVDMTARLPFPDESFDAVVCLEGIEHVLRPHDLLGELFRVCRVGGSVIVSTPNISSMFSRIQFFYTGTFHQFHFTQLRDLPPGTPDDRFHVSPVDLGWLWHHGSYWGGDVVEATADRIKKKFLLPVYGLTHLFGWPWAHKLFIRKGRPEHAERNRAMFRHARSWKVTTGRSLIVRYEKVRHVTEPPRTATLSRP